MKAKELDSMPKESQKFNSKILSARYREARVEAAAGRKIHVMQDL